MLVSEFLTLDGVMEAPEVWNPPFRTEEMTQDILDVLSASDALLYGRVTYEAMAAAWPSRTGELADLHNRLPKYVVSTTLQKAEWNNSRLIRGDVAQEVQQLKQQPGRQILIWGSRQLVHALMLHDLVDEYRLYVHPVVLGDGKRLFADRTGQEVMRLIDTKAFTSGVVALSYEPEGSGAGL